DKPCFEEECIIGEQYVTIATKREKSLCVNIVWVFDESASMRLEHEWLREISELDLPRVIQLLNVILTQNNTLNCNNSFAALTFGGDQKTESDSLGR
ncbi:hypothetical protein, partial [Salmonella sp. s54836]|uniref:hypothetical protein n=1 Tax=Salmonella sp. s54836 TaxID=3159673 RepID=UPI00397F98C3